MQPQATKNTRIYTGVHAQSHRSQRYSENKKAARNLGYKNKKNSENRHLVFFSLNIENTRCFFSEVFLFCIF